MWAGPRVRFPLVPKYILEDIEYSPDNSFCLGHNGRITAFGQLLNRQPDSLHMARILVDPGCRGRGYGRELCTDLIGIAQGRNAGTLTLNVYRDNPIGVGLYTSLGFREHREKSTPEYVHMIRITT